MSSQVYPLTLYYDSSCPLCKAEMENLMLRNQQGKLMFQDIHAQGFIPPEGYTQAMLLERLHGKQADGRIIHSLAVLRYAYAAVGLGWVAGFTRWPLLKPLMDGLYRFFARHRHRIPAFIGQGIFHLAARRALKKHCAGSGSCAIAQQSGTGAASHDNR